MVIQKPVKSGLAGILSVEKIRTRRINAGQPASIVKAKGRYIVLNNTKHDFFTSSDFRESLRVYIDREII